MEKILSPEEIETSWLTIAILLVSICIKLYMYSYNRRLGKKLDSAAMRATATDSLSDTVATTVVLAAMVIFQFTKVNIDAWCGCAVALFILYSGYSAARDTLSPLLGQPPSEPIASIEKIVLSHEEIMGIHDLIVHDYGPGLENDLPPWRGGCLRRFDSTPRCGRQYRAGTADQLHCDAVIHMDPIGWFQRRGASSAPRGRRIGQDYRSTPQVFTTCELSSGPAIQI